MVPELDGVLGVGAVHILDLVVKGVLHGALRVDILAGFGLDRCDVLLIVDLEPGPLKVLADAGLCLVFNVAGDVDDIVGDQELVFVHLEEGVRAVLVLDDLVALRL